MPVYFSISYISRNYNTFLKIASVFRGLSENPIHGKDVTNQWCMCGKLPSVDMWTIVPAKRKQHGADSGDDEKNKNEKRSIELERKEHTATVRML